MADSVFPCLSPGIKEGKIWKTCATMKSGLGFLFILLTCSMNGKGMSEGRTITSSSQKKLV
jgi:hypothetical protein